MGELLRYELEIPKELLNELSVPLARGDQNDAVLDLDIDFPEYSNSEAQVFDIQDGFPWGFTPMQQVGEWMEQANNASQFRHQVMMPMVAANLPEYHVQQGPPESSAYATLSDRFDLVFEPHPGPSRPRQLFINHTEHNNSHSSYTQFLNDENAPTILMPPYDFAYETPTPKPDDNKEERREAIVGNKKPVPDPAIDATFRCPHAECKRTKGFTRKDNVTQHRRLVHKEIIPIVRYRWGIPPEGDSGRKTQRRRGAANE